MDLKVLSALFIIALHTSIMNSHNQSWVCYLVRLANVWIRRCSTDRKDYRFSQHYLKQILVRIERELIEYEIKLHQPHTCVVCRVSGSREKASRSFSSHWFHHTPWLLLLLATSVGKWWHKLQLAYRLFLYFLYRIVLIFVSLLFQLHFIKRRPLDFAFPACFTGKSHHHRPVSVQFSLLSYAKPDSVR